MFDGNSKTFSNSSIEVLKDLLLESQSELDECFGLLKSNEDELQSVNEQIRILELKTDRDLSIFSPRTTSDSSYELLEKALALKEDLLLDHECLSEKYDKFSKRNKEIKGLLSDVHSRSKKVDIDSSKLSVLDIQEKERQRIARDLHDSVLQSMIHLIHKLELCSKYMDTDLVQAKLEIATCSKALRELIDAGRVSIFNLRPMSFDDFGFYEALRRLKISLSEQCNMNIEFSITDISSDETLILITIYRIIQELCNNSIKYSQGKNLKVLTEIRNNSYFISVSDDGIGFDLQDAQNKNNHFGIAMIQEEVLLLSSKIDFRSEIGKGTTVEISVPISIMKGVNHE